VSVDGCSRRVRRRRRRGSCGRSTVSAPDRPLLPSWPYLLIELPKKARLTARVQLCLCHGPARHSLRDRVDDNKSVM
jgi:hypothetical protein